MLAKNRGEAFGLRPGQTSTGNSNCRARNWFVGAFYSNDERFFINGAGRSAD